MTRLEAQKVLSTHKQLHERFKKTSQGKIKNRSSVVKKTSGFQLDLSFGS